MRSNVRIERVEEEMYSLVSQIDFGDISDIDAYWESLSEALLDLPIKDWINKPSDGSPVSIVISEIAVHNAIELSELARKMEELCDSGSNSSISEEDLETLQSHATKFESDFETFLDQLDELMKDE